MRPNSIKRSQCMMWDPGVVYLYSTASNLFKLVILSPVAVRDYCIHEEEESAPVSIVFSAPVCEMGNCLYVYLYA